MIDPVTGLLAGFSGAASVAQGISGLIPSEADKYNKAELEKLQKKKVAGKLGLTDEQQQVRSNAFQDPVRQAATVQGKSVV